jgi:hypothetical protein
MSRRLTRRLRPKRLCPEHRSVSWPLLKATGKYEPKNGSTYCNWFARDFVKELLG